MLLLLLAPHLVPAAPVHDAHIDAAIQMPASSPVMAAGPLEESIYYVPPRSGARGAILHAAVDAYECH